MNNFMIFIRILTALILFILGIYIQHNVHRQLEWDRKLPFSIMLRYSIKLLLTGILFGTLLAWPITNGFAIYTICLAATGMGCIPFILYIRINSMK